MTEEIIGQAILSRRVLIESQGIEYVCVPRLQVPVADLLTQVRGFLGATEHAQSNASQSVLIVLARSTWEDHR